MKLYLDRLSEGLEVLPNLPILVRAFARFDAGRVMGLATLTEHPSRGEFRLMFFGTGEFGGTVLNGPTVSPLLLETPALAHELCEVTNTFLRQVRQLDNSRKLQNDLSLREI